jgi:hypothetical protein
MTIGERKKVAERIRMPATCAGEKSTRPFFMRMNELPQISDKMIIRDHESKTLP